MMYMSMKYEESEKVNVGRVKEHFSADVTQAKKGHRTIVCHRNYPVHLFRAYVDSSFQYLSRPMGFTGFQPLLRWFQTVGIYS